MNFTNNTYLAEQLKIGNTKAYDYLMHTFYQKLCAYAYTLSHNHDTAEDIVQNVFVNIWVKKKKINPLFPIKNFLYKLVYNEFINQYRKNKPVEYLEKKYFEAVDTSVDNTTKNIEKLIKIVNKEIESLPPKCKQIFLLSKKEGLTHTEIAEYLDVSTKTIEGHITRAFKILKDKLDTEGKAIFFLLFNLDVFSEIKKL